ncbi:sodium-translocating pyrophosphatase [Candidatus Falkowbacteria bacterium RBG_13_39_14]|uniref:Putative K(+)-stimulated pyrophosphate-energized sodium pump n=1 Tax=Candidatus Falkowbacteria bacterium RBG_13_39_14 TaxID=1797985 RepID=A0A1F5S500_9BACT|nr:MAG: sodium-translocating pyrophosphatase [Candidatus Falkowbacteria bacterium RBG_13_39_14]
MNLTILSIAGALIALAYAGYLAFGIKKQEEGDEKMKEIALAIRKGAMAFLKKEYKILSIFVLVIAAAMFFVPSLEWKASLLFICGALFSVVAGFIGMQIATIANVRTANACKTGQKQGLNIAFSSGSVMGLTVVGLGVLGVAVFHWIFKDPQVIYAFGFGASFVALFARVGGGIYTKAADVGADLVGKVESGIPEDDPRNPATIADNVGDNVGDVAGMGADLFESYVESIIAAMVLGSIGVMRGFGDKAIILPLVLAAVGIISSLIGNFFVTTAKKTSPDKALNRGIFGASAIMLIASYFVIRAVLGTGTHGDITANQVFFSVITGLVAGIVIGLITEYYTSGKNKPTQRVAKAAEMGAGTNLIAGLGLGMMSTVIPVIAISIAILAAYNFAGLYGIAISAVGMLSTLGITLATDTYGPIADNAAGIAEMAGMGEEVRKTAEGLDAVGNTTAAIGKGFAIGSAALTALVLFISFGEIAGISGIDVTKPAVIVGMFIGAALPFLFSALTMEAVGRAAQKMVEEVRRQFREIPGIMEYKAKPDYERCVSISTGGALKEMMAPGIIAVVAPVLVGFFLGAESLGGLLAGSTVTGFMLAVMMANAGGAWDNAKKYIEEGNLGGKGSAAHKAAVTGDTVGDPFKDTSGPSLNILIKLLAIIALIIAPLL